ncbi:hypothetical protein EDB83DRAFT_472663 [Lactarius deliciosus]|nr:hypothetical protein EDB83DRAFT_472663 [Lactarius deliciosus]
MHSIPGSTFVNFVHPAWTPILSHRSSFSLNMTDWNSPAIITAEYFALVKLYHATWGLFLWEFVVNIRFEYSVFTGKRKFRSSFLLYLGVRWCPLFCVITILVGFDSANRINCQAFVISVFLFSHLSLACASALIVLRIAAIWGLNKIAISIASAAWLANTGVLIHSTLISSVDYLDISNTQP